MVDGRVGKGRPVRGMVHGCRWLLEEELSPPSSGGKVSIPSQVP